MRRPASPDPPRGKPAGGYLFLPRRLARGKFLKWLRRTHAWCGLWGAALGLLFGGTGFLLNHREIMKIPAARMEQKEMQLPLPEPRPADPEALARWLARELGLESKPHRALREPAKTVIWNGLPVPQPARWQVTIRTPRESMQADYWEGNAFVTVKRGDANALALLSNLHKGVGLGAGWVLLADTLAGGLVVLALTGVLLWTRLHGPRLAAALLGLGSLGLALWFAVRAL